MEALDETTRAILYLLYEGASTTEILHELPDVTPDDISRAAGEALALLETDAARIETREERVARVRQKHAKAFEPWTTDEDVSLVQEWKSGATVAALSRAFARPAGGVRMRLEKLLGPNWRASKDVRA